MDNKPPVSDDEIALATYAKRMENPEERATRTNKPRQRTAYDYQRLEEWRAFYKEQQRKLQEATSKMDDPMEVKLHLSDISDMVLPLLLVVHPWHQGRETWVAYWRAIMERYDISQKDAKGVSELTYENLQYLYTSLAGTIAERAETIFQRVVYNPF